MRMALFLACVAACLAGGCEHAMTTYGLMDAPAREAPGSWFAGGEPDEAPPAPDISPPRGDSPHLAVIEPRKVVYTGRLDLAVADPARAVAQTKALAEKLGGYMQRQTRESIVIRVPAGRFDEAVAAVEQLGTLFDKDLQAQDVTETYVDLEIRLTNARALLTKLQSLLAKARDVKDALAVEKEIARVRAEVETLTGKLNRLKNQVAFATLTARFRTAAEAPEELKVRLPFWWLGSLGLEVLLRFEGGGGLF